VSLICATGSRSSPFCGLECVRDHDDTVAERTSRAVLQADVQARTQEQVLGVPDAGECGIQPQVQLVKEPCLREHFATGPKPCIRMPAPGESFNA
jgi:hypothetical protein